MADRSSAKITVYAAVAGNMAVAVIKFAAALLTGSSVMLSEGFHSVADCGNEMLLIYGEHRASMPADALHPFGHGREVYFWSFVVSVLLFAIGSGLSFYEGVQHMLHPVEIRDAFYNYLVLGLSFGFEGGSWLVAWRSFRKAHPTATFRQGIVRSKDPTVIVVLLEDSAALIGIAIAFAGTLAAQLLDAPALDGVASLAIGVLLAGVSYVLARESKSLLIGEPAVPKTMTLIHELASSQDALRDIGEIWTTHVGPDQIAVVVNGRLAEGADAREIEAALSAIEARAREEVDKSVLVTFRPVGGAE